jgi:long-chain acyl-CoA synthetase
VAVGKIAAVASLKGGTGKNTIAFLKDKLSPIEMPKLVEFRTSLPKTLIGKPSKKMLLDEEAAKAKAAKVG